MASRTEPAIRRLSVALKVAMKARDLTVTDLHKRTGIGRETIYRILRAEALPTTDIIIRLAAELKVSPGALLDNTVEGTGNARGTSRQADATTLTEINARLGAIEELLRRKRS